VLARVQEPRERLASCARRRPGSSLEDAGSIPATSTVQDGIKAHARSHTRVIQGMSTERVTVSLPDDVRQAAHRIAEDRGTSFSAVVTEALTAWLRARLVDAWLAEHQASYGKFDENELRRLAGQAGVPYVGSGRPDESAA
jgi:predicted transcriptional regulator